MQTYVAAPKREFTSVNSNHLTLMPIYGSQIRIVLEYCVATIAGSIVSTLYLPYWVVPLSLHVHVYGGKKRAVVFPHSG